MCRSVKTIRSLIGMPVVCQNRKIGRTVQAELEDDLTRLRGIWVSAGFRGGRWIPAESLQMLGSVAVLSDSPGQRRRMRFSPLFRRATATDGTRLGAITGAEIDEISFAVTALELSQGFWDDLLTRRRRVRRFTANRETGEIIIDPAELEREGWTDEGRYDEGPDRRDADRLGGGDDVRRDELADRAQVEPGGQADRQLAFRQGGRAVKGAVTPRPAKAAGRIP